MVVGPNEQYFCDLDISHVERYHLERHGYFPDINSPTPCDILMNFHCVSKPNLITFSKISFTHAVPIYNDFMGLFSHTQHRNNYWYQYTQIGEENTRLGLCVGLLFNYDIIKQNTISNIIKNLLFSHKMLMVSPSAEISISFTITVFSCFYVHTFLPVHSWDYIMEAI